MIHIYNTPVPEHNKTRCKRLQGKALEAFITEAGWYQDVAFSKTVTSGGNFKTERECNIALPRDMTDLTYLDIGCAQGVYVLHAAIRGAVVSGVDRNPKQIEQATRLALHFGIKADLRVCDFNKLPRSPTYDFVSMMSMFHHLHRPLEAFRKIRALTNKVFVGEFPIWTEGEKRWEKVDQFPDDWLEKYHKAYPTLECLKEELAKHFRIVGVIGPLKHAGRYLMKCLV